MLFQKSLLRELRSTAGGVLAVLMTTLLTVILIRALGRAASGRVDGELVVPLIVFNTVALMSTVLMLTVYISVLMVLSRWWRDSEMVIWLTSGRSLTDLIRPVWRFLWPMLVLITIVSTVVAPWARQQITAFEDEIKNRGDAQRVSPGQFRESLSGKRVFFVENPDDENGRIGTVFVRSDEGDGRRVLLLSSTGRFEQDAEGHPWEVLERGYRNDLVPGTLESRSTAFDVYRIRLDQGAPVGRSQETVRSMPIMDLAQRTDPSAQGELVIRVGLPLLTLTLAFLAIPLSFTNVRSGRAVNLLLALLIYVIASNLFGAAKGAVTQDKMHVALALGIIPTAVLGITAVMFWWRTTQPPGPSELLSWVRMRWLRARGA